MIQERVVRALGRTARAGLVIAVVTLGLVGSTATKAWATSSSILCDGYAGCSVNGFTDNGYPAHEYTSYWRMDAGDECTNYTAYVESAAFGVATPDYLLGNGGEWAVNAAANGVLVNHTPSVGAVAEWDGGSPGIPSPGHVAVVEEVGPNGSWIDISQQHIYSDIDGYDWTRIYAGSDTWQSWPSNFIHFPTNVPVVNGRFYQTPDNRIWEIVGGAPLPVTSWDAFGGAQPVMPITQQQFDRLGVYPANGTAVTVARGAPWGYVFAGDAPIYVPKWGDVPERPSVTIDPTDLIDVSSNGPFSHVRRYPANGTAVVDATPGVGSGAGYVFAGGAPLYVSNWRNVGRPHFVRVAGYALNHYASSGPLSHVRQYPANDTAVVNSTPGVGHGDGYVFAAGAPLYVSNWRNVGRPHFVDVDGYALDHFATTGPLSHVLSVPAEGTFLRTLSGAHVWRVAGGSALRMADCAVVGGCTAPVVIDSWAIRHAGTAITHLHREPVTGTVLEGLPSHRYWVVRHGQRGRTPLRAGVVRVDDSSLTSVPLD